MTNLSHRIVGTREGHSYETLKDDNHINKNVFIIISVFALTHTQTCI